MEDLRRIPKSKGVMELGMGAVQIPRVFRTHYVFDRLFPYPYALVWIPMKGVLVFMNPRS